MSDYPHAIRISPNGRAVVIVSCAPEGTRSYMSPDHAEEYADRIIQAADQARHGAVEQLEQLPLRTVGS